MMRMHPFWVIGQDAQPCLMLALNQANAVSWCGCAWSSSAIRTLTSSSARIRRVFLVLAVFAQLVDQLVADDPSFLGKWPEAVNHFRRMHRQRLRARES